MNIVPYSFITDEEVRTREKMALLESIGTHSVMTEETIGSFGGISVEKTRWQKPHQ
jgi:hypothetical protein